MDAEAQHTERDRSSHPVMSEETPDTEGAEGRSRFALVARAADRLPGGRISLTVLFCLFSLLLLTRFVVQPFEIPSGSMEPALRIGDRVLVNKLAYRFGAEPRRGDVVVFDGTGYFGDADYIKRVVGVGGDHVVCCDRQGRIEVNGRLVDESTFLYPGDEPSEVPFDVVVPDGTLFVLGDHRSDSSDSRDHLGSPGGGMIPLGGVIGRADWIAWPPGHWTRIERADGHADVDGRARTGSRVSAGSRARADGHVRGGNRVRGDGRARGDDRVRGDGRARGDGHACVPVTAGRPAAGTGGRKTADGVHG